MEETYDSLRADGDVFLRTQLNLLLDLHNHSFVNANYYFTVNLVFSLPSNISLAFERYPLVAKELNTTLIA